MKILALIMLLVILPMSTASTYTLGSHQVSFNVSEPYNSSAKLDPPTYFSDTNSWIYTLNLTKDSQHAIIVHVFELSSPDYGRIWPSEFGKVRAQYIKENGIGGYKFSTMDFNGYPALSRIIPSADC